MKNATKVILAVIAGITSILQVPGVQHAVGGFMSTHPAWSAVIGGVMALLATVHDPKKTANMLLLAVTVGMLTMCAPAVRAQTTLPGDPAPAPSGVQNFYAAGLSYSVNASPGVAGTGLYAHRLSGSTYAFTVIDALPSTLKPFTVTSNIGAGVAQKVHSFGKIDVFMPAAAGISWSGTNTGWQWNGGAMAVIPLKRKVYYLAPSVRFLKSSVSNGSGYQPIIGVLFGWGH